MIKYYCDECGFEDNHFALKHDIHLATGRWQINIGFVDPNHVCKGIESHICWACKKIKLQEAISSLDNSKLNRD